MTNYLLSAQGASSTVLLVVTMIAMPIPSCAAGHARSLPTVTEAGLRAAYARQYTSVMQAMDTDPTDGSRGWESESHPGWPMVPINSVITVYVIAIVLACAALALLGLGLILAAATGDVGTILKGKFERDDSDIVRADQALPREGCSHQANI